MIFYREVEIRFDWIKDNMEGDEQLRLMEKIVKMKVPNIEKVLNN